MKNRNKRQAKKKRASKARRTHQATTRTIGQAARIYFVSALWRADQPDGGWVELGFSEETQKPPSISSARSKTHSLNNISHITSAGLVELLRAWAPRTREPLPVEEAFSFASVVYFLEQRGDLVADEYNGVLWTWSAKGDPKTLIQSEGRSPLHGMTGEAVELSLEEATSPAVMGAVMDYLRRTPKAQGEN